MIASGGKSILSMRSTDEEMWRAIKRMTSDRKDIMDTVNCVDQQEQLVYVSPHLLYSFLCWLLKTNEIFYIRLDL